MKVLAVNRFIPIAKPFIGDEEIEAVIKVLEMQYVCSRRRSQAV